MVCHAWKFLTITDTDTYDGCTNIFNTVSANQDEEIWIELQSHRDLKRMDDITSEAMKVRSCMPKALL